MKTLPAISDRPVRLGILISGGGRTLLNFVDVIDRGELRADIPLVIASQPDCAGLQKATAAGLSASAVVRRDFGSTTEYSDDIFGRMRNQQIDLVLLAGFLCLLEIPPDFQHRVLNIHPSLIPAFCGKGFYGARVHQAAIERGARVSGCTVHFADNEYDHGPVIVQRAVSIPDRASADQLAGLVFQQECIAYPEAVRKVVSGQLQIEGQRTFMSNSAPAP